MNDRRKEGFAAAAGRSERSGGRENGGGKGLFAKSAKGKIIFSCVNAQNFLVFIKYAQIY